MFVKNSNACDWYNYIYIGYEIYPLNDRMYVNPSCLENTMFIADEQTTGSSSQWTTFCREMLVFCCKAIFSEVKFEDSKRVIITHKSNDRRYNGEKEKGQTIIIHKTLHWKLKIESHEPYKKLKWNRCSGGVNSSCTNYCGTRRITLVTNPVITHEWGKDLWLR